MSTMSGRAAGLSILVSVMAFAAFGDIVKPTCYNQLWSGLTQSTGVGEERCAKYTNCPVSIKCYPGGPYLIAGDVESQNVSCKKYVGGQWDPQKGRCVGGDPETTEETVTISVQKCSNGCN